MNWLFAHPYVSASVTAGALLIVGLLVISSRSGVNPQSGGTQTWGTFGVGLDDPLGKSSEAPAAQENLYSLVRESPPFQYIPVSTPTETDEEPADEFDFDAFLASITKPKTSAPAEPTGTGLEDVYSFIPSGLISTSTWGSRTQAQSAIYNYGNEAGGYIISYDEQYRNAAQILKDQFEDRTNEGKNARMIGLADAMIGVGRSLGGITLVPSTFKSANTALAQSYIEMGTKLKVIPTAKTDETMLDAIVEYNAAVESFTKSYVALATLFSAYGVTFRMDEEGSAFMFTNTPAL